MNCHCRLKGYFCGLIKVRILSQWQGFFRILKRAFLGLERLRRFAYSCLALHERFLFLLRQNWHIGFHLHLVSQGLSTGSDKSLVIILSFYQSRPFETL